MNAAGKNTAKKPAFEKQVRLKIESYLAKEHPRVHVAGFLLSLTSAAYWARLDVAKDAARPSEKDRRRAMDKVRTASHNLIAAIDELDEDARWHFFGCVHTGASLAQMGVLERRNAELSGNKHHHSTRVMVERLRQASLLPVTPLDRHGAQLEVALAVFQAFRGQGIEFTASGFGKLCLTETFKLADLSTDSIAYWVKRAKKAGEDLP